MSIYWPTPLPRPAECLCDAAWVTRGMVEASCWACQATIEGWGPVVPSLAPVHAPQRWDGREWPAFVPPGMTPEMEAHGRLALAAGLRWVPGMKWWEPDVPRGYKDWGRVDDGEDSPMGGPGALPDLSDAPTLGALAAQVREALGEPTCWAWAVQWGDRLIWSIGRSDRDGDIESLRVDGHWGAGSPAEFVAEPTEPAAWVAALEAARRAQG